jgi:hypothetical protein
MLTPKDIEKMTMPLYEKSLKENKEFWRQRIKERCKNRDNTHQMPEHAQTCPALSHADLNTVLVDSVW